MNRLLRLCVPLNHTIECLSVFNNTDQDVYETLNGNGRGLNTVWIAVSTTTVFVLFVVAILIVYAIRASNIWQMGES